MTEPTNPDRSIRDLVDSAGQVAKQLNRRQRALLVEDVIRAVYDAVKYQDPEGEGLDGRDGPERRGLGRIVDAASNHSRALVSLARHDQPPATSSSGDVEVDEDEVPAEDEPTAHADPPRAKVTVEDLELMLTDPTESFQRDVNEPQPRDEAPIELTVLQAQKSQCIVEAYIDDHTDHTGVDHGSLYAGPARLVARLLMARALTASGIPNAVTDPWKEIDALPWPPPPGMRPRR